MKFPHISQLQTASGWTLIHCEQKHLPLSSMRIIFGGGALSDTRQTLGCANMSDKLLARHIRKKINDIRMPYEFDLSCDLTHSVLSIDCLDQDMPNCMAFVGKELLNRQVEYDSIERQRFLINQAINAGKDHADMLCHWMGRERYYGESHPLRYGIGGNLASIQSLTKSQLQNSLTNRYAQPKGCVVLVGNHTLKQAESWVEKHLHRAQAFEPTTPPSPSPCRGRYAMQHNGSEQIELTIFAEAPSRKSGISPASTLGTIGLGGCFLSRLNRKLRIDTGLSYGASATYTHTETDGLVVISTSIDRERIEDAIALTEETLISAGKGWDETELKMVKENHKSLVYSAWETIANLADFLESSIVNGLNPHTINDRMSAIQRCEIPEIEKAMSNISSGKRCLSLCGNLWSNRSQSEVEKMNFLFYRPQKISLEEKTYVDVDFTVHSMPKDP